MLFYWLTLNSTNNFPLFTNNSCNIISSKTAKWRKWNNTVTMINFLQLLKDMPTINQVLLLPEHHVYTVSQQRYIALCMIYSRCWITQVELNPSDITLPNHCLTEIYDVTLQRIFNSVYVSTRVRFHDKNVKFQLWILQPWRKSYKIQSEQILCKTNKNKTSIVNENKTLTVLEVLIQYNMVGR